MLSSQRERQEVYQQLVVDVSTRIAMLAAKSGVARYVDGDEAVLVELPAEAREVLRARHDERHHERLEILW